MGLSADDYTQAAQALLPRGALWTRDADAILTDVLAALAAEFARVDGRAQDLVDEANAATTSELLSDWERVFGLPDDCVTTPQTVDQRRAALEVKMSSVDDLTAQFFITVAARIGMTVTIDEAVDGPFVWRVNGSGVTITDFVVGSAVAGDALRIWSNDLLECTIKRLNPAHTKVLFAYLTLLPSGIASSEAVGTPTLV